MSKRLLGLCLVAACAGTAKAPEYVVKLNEQYGHLANGTKVILLPDHSSKLVEVDVRVAVGSKEDPPGKAGLAHFVEHLLFQGRPAPDQPSVGAALRSRSVYNNASTSWDYTHYQTLAPAAELPAILAIEGLRLGGGCESVPRETFEREREVVRNELRQRFGSPEGRMLARLHEIVYGPGHAYARMIGGSDEDVASITLEDVCQFVKAHYVPERLTVIIAGDFDEKQAQALLSRHLGAIPARAGAPLVTVDPVKLDGRREKIALDIERQTLVVAWPMPPRFGKDSFASLFLGSLIRFKAYEVFKDDADYVDIVELGGAQAPVLAAVVTLDKGASPASVASAMLKRGDDAHVGVANVRMEGVRAGLLGELGVELETLHGRAATYADYAQFEPGVSFGTQVERLSKFDSGHLKEVARRTFESDRAMTLTITPSRTGAATLGVGFAGAEEDARDELPVDPRDAARPIALPDEATTMSRARRFELPNGLRVVLKETSAPLPVVTAKLSFAAGSGHDPAKQRGLASVAAIAYTARVRALHFYFTGDVKPDVTTFTARASSLYVNDLVDAVTVLADEFRGTVDSKYLRDELEDLKKRSMVKKYSALSAGLGRAVYGDAHPYAMALDPFAAAAMKFDQGDMQDFIARHFHAANGTLVIAGVFDSAAIEQRIRDKLDGLPRGKPTPQVTAPAPRAGQPVIWSIPGSADEPLVEVRVAWAVPPGIAGGYAARLVLVEMLDRRVAMVRERLGASYGLNAVYQPTVGPAIVAVVGAVDAARAGQALSAARAAIDELRRGEGFLEDFVRARAAVLGRLVADASDSGSLAARLTELELFGMPADHADRLVHEIARLSPRDVLALARKELEAGAEVIVAEGARPALDSMFAELELPAKVVAAK